VPTLFCCYRSNPPFAQADTGATAIFCYELDAGLLEGGRDRNQSGL
jgi:hypothetical protein